MTKAASRPPVKVAAGGRVSARRRIRLHPAGREPGRVARTSRSSDESSCCALHAPSSARRVAPPGSQAMNVWLARAALRIRGLPPSARVVLLAHVDACRPSGRTCLAGLDELAQACELSPKHVMRLRAQLVEQGHLRRVTAAHPGQRPVYEVLPAVPIPVLAGHARGSEPDQAVASGRTAAGDRSHSCDPPYKPQGITPPTPPPTPPHSDPPVSDGGRGAAATNRPGGRPDPGGAPGPDAVALAQAAVAALRSGHRARIDELGQRRLERAVQPLVSGWTPTDLATRIAAEGVDRAENLAAVLAAILRRYALEPSPRELRAAHRAAEQARRSQPPPEPCGHGDPSGCTACSFCRRGLADPDGERCTRCAPSVDSPIPMPQVVNR